MPTHLFIVSRQHPDLFEYLLERFAADAGVRVIRDRRVGERRRRAVPAAAERRRAERRSRPEIDEQLRVCSHAIVTVHAQATTLREALQWIQGIPSHAAVIRRVLEDHERLRQEADAVKHDNERLREERDRFRRELEEIGTEFARVLAIVDDLRARLRGYPAQDHPE